MVTKKKSKGEKEAKKGRVKVGKLKLNKETVKDLTPSKTKQVGGGLGGVVGGVGGGVVGGAGRGVSNDCPYSFWCISVADGGCTNQCTTDCGGCTSYFPCG